MRVHAGRNHRHEHAAALVVTLIVCTVLAIVVVALMQNTGLDRASSAGMTNHYRAKLAAESGASAAMATVADLITRYSDSVTVWQNIGGGAANGTNNEATVVYFRASGGNSNVGASPAAFGSQVGLWAVPLVSRTSAPTSLNNSPVALASIVNSVPLVSGVTTNLNATNSVYTEPFVGSRTSTNAGAPVTAGQWVYITKFGGATNATNPYVARFAYLVEDESFKVNLNVATNGNRGSGLGLTPAETRLNGSLGTSTNPQLQSAAVTDQIVAERSIFGPSGFPTLPTAALAAGLDNTNARSELAFLTTAKSSGLNFSRGGFRRVDVNVAAGSGDTRSRLDRLISAITNSNGSPNFGQRFYRLAAGADVNSNNVVTADHAAIYLNKVAANILDYLDTDSTPTIVRNLPGFPVRTGVPNLTNTNDPIFNLGIGGEGPNPYIAIGTELRPYLYGYAIGVQLTNMTPVGYQSIGAGGSGPPSPDQANFGFLLDHYFEFWNAGTKDVVVGVGAPNDTEVFIDGMFLEVANAPGWSAGNNSLFPPGSRDFSAALPAGARFPAGRSSLVTTAPLSDAQLFAPGAQNIISVHTPALDATRSYTGITTNVLNTNSVSFPSTDRFYSVSLESRNSSAQLDYETEVLLGAPSGIIEMFPALALGSMRVWAKGNLPAIFTNRSSLFGNVGATGSAPRAVEGDPRTLNEQLDLRPYALGGSSTPNQTRFETDSGHALGTPDANRVNPGNWVDFSTFVVGNADASLVVADSQMRSVGELGHLTDPARVPASVGSLSNVVFSRSGGRTLRIGQPELPSWYDGNQTNASRTWTSWRLTDIFTTTNATVIEGLINPNGALRDGGAALYAALDGLTYLASPAGAPNTAGTTISGNNIRTLVTNVISRLTNVNVFNPAGSLNPFWERGEISELPILNSGTTLLGSGINLSNTIDRGREELVRRSIEMITPRGNVFTVYAIGQSIQTTATATNVLSTVRLKSTFQLDPVVPVAAVDDLFTPTDSAAVAARFAAITNFTLEIISRSYD